MSKKTASASTLPGFETVPLEGRAEKQKRAAREEFPDLSQSEIDAVGGLTAKQFTNWCRKQSQLSYVNQKFPDLSQSEIDAVGGLTAKQFTNWCRKQSQLSYVNQKFPDLDSFSYEEERLIISKLTAMQFLIWKTLVEAGKAGMCRKCLGDVCKQQHGSDLGTNGSGPLRDLRHLGFEVPNGKQQTDVCGTHPGRVTWDYLNAELPCRSSHRLRAKYSAAEEAKMKNVLGGKDAFDGSAGFLEIDHRVPMDRQRGEEIGVDVNNPKAVSDAYMLLTRTHNTLKREKCLSCNNEGIRPPFLDIEFHFEGGDAYEEEVGCNGCGWAHTEQWKKSLNETLVQVKSLNR